MISKARVVAGAHASDEAIVAHARQPPPARRVRRTDVDRGGGHRRKYAPPGAAKCESRARKGAPGLPARHGGQPAGGPGRRSGACWGCGAGARLHPCTDHGKAHPWELVQGACEISVRNRACRQLPRACSCPGRCPPNAGLIRDRTAQPSCGCPHGKERRALAKVGRAFVPEGDAPVTGGAPRRPTAGESRGTLARAGRMAGRPSGVDSALAGLQGRLSGKRAPHGHFPPRGHADRRTTHPARLHHRAR